MSSSSLKTMLPVTTEDVPGEICFLASEWTLGEMPTWVCKAWKGSDLDDAQRFYPSGGPATP